ncbi:hypothetical protein BJ875DRAFT_483309 [Amylocarpus encephaloides]|uniref:Uncharacterized protein n=1 Tax=Amylocarpus encephaloides TaxID=45428 RepID=A0A9P7YKS8_9HELO|nr:hypothetical protein BJ875DRAFT_483309 [Amylocarpus encephaloides]
MKAPNPALLDKLPSAYRNGVYREESHGSGAGTATASASSSRRPRGVAYREEELPAYEEAPLLSASDASFQSHPKPDAEIRRRWYQPPPDLPFSTHGHNPRDVQTYFPDYSSDAETLRQMIYEQASYPPTYYLELKGIHNETTYRASVNGNGITIGHLTGHHHGRRRFSNSNESRTTKTITDFVIRINITHLLSIGPTVGGELHLLEDNKRGYRGGIIKRLTPNVTSPDIDNQHEELKAWCDKYVADPSALKSFTLKRAIINHDTKRLESLIRSLVASTNYRGHVSVHFPITHETVTIYSPGRINQWRMKTWIRWVFYLTFLWIFSWLYLFLSTARYSVVRVVFPYADASPEDALHGVERRPTVMSEASWFELWEKSIKRAVLGRMNCRQTDEIGDEYRLATDNIAARGDMPQSYGSVNMFPGGVVSLFGVSGQFCGQWQDGAGWGYDC